MNIHAIHHRARPLITALASVLVATSLEARSGRPLGDGLGDIAHRLRAGERAAIDELLARTRPAASGLDDARARIAALRADIERLSTRRGARPVFPLPAGELVRRSDSNVLESAAANTDALRESRAWLRAGEPERALRALPSTTSTAADKDTALYLEARALEGLGRTAEALEAYRRVVATAESPLLRARAAADVTHVEWRASLSAGREGRP